MNRFKLILPILGLLIGGCAAPYSVNASFLDSSTRQPKTNIQIFSNFDEVPWKYKNIALITAESTSGFGTREESAQKLIERIVKEARALGADGIVINSSGGGIVNAGTATVPIMGTNSAGNVAVTGYSQTNISIGQNIVNVTAIVKIPEAKENIIGVDPQRVGQSTRSDNHAEIERDAWIYAGGGAAAFLVLLFVIIL